MISYALHCVFSLHGNSFRADGRAIGRPWPPESPALIPCGVSIGQCHRDDVPPPGARDDSASSIASWQLQRSAGTRLKSQANVRARATAGSRKLLVATARNAPCRPDFRAVLTLGRHHRAAADLIVRSLDDSFQAKRFSNRAKYLRGQLRLPCGRRAASRIPASDSIS